MLSVLAKQPFRLRTIMLIRFLNKCMLRNILWSFDH